MDLILVEQLIDATLSTEGLAVTLVYVDATQGWLVTDSGLQSEAPTALYLQQQVEQYYLWRF